MILEIILTILLVLLWIGISINIFFFVINIFSRKKINNLLNFFAEEDSLNVIEKINFIKELNQSENNNILTNLINEALTFYDDIYLVNRSMFQSELKYLIENEKLFNFKFVALFHKINDLNSNLVILFVYLQKLNFLCRKTYDYKSKTSDLFFNLEMSLLELKQQANVLELPWINEFDEKIQDLQSKIEVFEKNHTFPSDAFESKVTEIIHDINFYNNEASYYINNLLNIKYIKILIKQIEQKIDFAQTEMIGILPKIILPFNKVKKNMDAISRQIYKLDQYKLKTFLRGEIQSLEKIENILFKEYNSRKIILKIQDDMDDILRELREQQQTLMNEISLKHEQRFTDKYNNSVEIFNDLKTDAHFLQKIEIDNLSKYSNNLINFEQFFEKVNIFNSEIDSIASDLTKIDRIKNELNDLLIRINNSLLECEIMSKKIPSNFEINYDSIIEEFSNIENDFINSFKDRTFSTQENLEKVQKLEENVNQLKLNIKDKLFNINYITKTIINFNKYNTTRNFAENLKSVEELMYKDRFKQAYQILYELSKNDFSRN